MPSLPGLGRYSSSVMLSSTDSSRDRSMAQPVDINLTLRKWRDTSEISSSWGAGSATGSRHWELQPPPSGRSVISESPDTYRFESRSREPRISDWSDLDRKSSRWEHEVPSLDKSIVQDYSGYRYENRETSPLHRWNAMEKRMSPCRDSGTSRGSGTSVGVSRWQSAESYSHEARMSDVLPRAYESSFKDGGKVRASRWDPVAPLPSTSGNLGQRIGDPIHPTSSGRSANKYSSSSTSEFQYRAVEAPERTDSTPDSFGILAEGLSTRSSDSSTRLALFVAFKKFGKISEVQIHGSGESRYGLVFFRHQYSQETALKALQASDFFGSPLKLLPWTLPVPEKEESEPLPNQDVTADKPGASRYLLVQDVDPRTRTEHMQKLFQDCGEILDIKVEQSEGKTKYVVLEFADVASVCKAINEIDGYKGLKNQRTLWRQW